MGCLHRFDHDTVLAMRLLAWFQLEKIVIQLAKVVKCRVMQVKVMMVATCIVDITYIVITIYAIRTQNDPYFGALKGMRILSIGIGLLEIFLKVFI
jgi:hypothetical protein